MKVAEIWEHFLATASWVDPARTVDGVIVGDSEADVRRVAVTWISSFDAIRQAVQQGCQMLITHEPTFWDHGRDFASTKDWQPGTLIHGIGTRKLRFIEDNGLVIFRLHDVWDRFPEIGIPWAWAKFLGFEERPVELADGGAMHRYDIEPVTLDDFARRIASKTATIGEPYVQVVGDGGRKLSRIGLGTGCICHIDIYRQMGCDAGVIVDDGTHYWRDIQRAADDGYPLIRVNHATAEEPGMVTLAAYVKETFPSLEVAHIPHGCSFRLVG